MPDPTLYLFDGYNLLHAGAFADVRELRDVLASFVAVRGARGVLVLDGEGPDEVWGPLEVRWATHADSLLERLAAENRATEQVVVVSSDSAVRGTAGRETQVVRSETFVRDLSQAKPSLGTEPRRRLGDRLDPTTRERLERWRRGER